MENRLVCLPRGSLDKRVDKLRCGPDNAEGGGGGDGNDACASINKH